MITSSGVAPLSCVCFLSPICPFLVAGPKPEAAPTLTVAESSSRMQCASVRGLSPEIPAGFAPAKQCVGAPSCRVQLDAEATTPATPAIRYTRSPTYHLGSGPYSLPPPLSFSLSLFTWSYCFHYGDATAVASLTCMRKQAIHSQR